MPSASVITATKVKPGDLRSWRNANFRSFISLGAQCLDWINAGGAARGEQTREQRSRAEDYERRAEQKWIVSRDLIKLRRDQSPERERSDNADGEPNHNGFHSLIHNKAQHIAGLRAERHPHSDLTGALFDCVSDRAVNADAREQQRD